MCTFLTIGTASVSWGSTPNMRKARCSTLHDPRQRIASRYDWTTALFTSTSRTHEKRSMDGASGDEAGMKHPIYIPVKQKI